jgi:sec-independent protein translocase protein TatA
MAEIGWPELLVIGLVFVLLFGTQKIPGAMKGLGEAIRNFKSSMKGQAEEMREISKEIEKV